MYFEILPSPYPKGKNVIVRQISHNHKVLNTSEVLKNRANALKNIEACISPGMVYDVFNYQSGYKMLVKLNRTPENISIIKPTKFPIGKKKK